MNIFSSQLKWAFPCFKPIFIDKHTTDKQSVKGTADVNVIAEILMDL